MAPIAIIIVNWNGQQLLKKVLTAVYSQTYKNFRVIFVDNNSKDDSVNYVKQNFTQTKIIRLNHNYGTVVGRNVGIKTALQNPDLKYIITLDSDAVPEPESFANLVKRAESDKKIGIVNSKILYSQPPVIQNTGMFPSPDLFFSQRSNNQPANSNNQSTPLFAPCTASALIKKELVEEIGLFDEDFYMYQDDVEFGLRALLFDWQNIYEPASITYHYASQSSKKVPELMRYYAIRNVFLLAYKFYPWRLFLTQCINLKDRLSPKKQDKTALKALFASLYYLPAMIKKRRQIYRQTGKTSRDAYNIIKYFEIDRDYVN